METKYMLDGAHVSVIKFNEEFIVDDLPPKVYNVRFNPLSGFYLEIATELLELPDKIYGNTPARVRKCIETYKSRNSSTGILLTGDKGTGKTLLMSLLANSVMDELDLPVLLVKEPHHGAQFESFIETVGECALVFDEFGKMYSNNRHNSDSDVPQSSLLSLMDGVDKTKRMFIMTENSEFDINDFMLNRPSRVYYHFKYKKLDESSITGYCVDKGVAADITQDIIDLSRRSSIFSFDMLQSIVEEQLRFGCTVDDAVSDLNIDLRETTGAMMEIVKVMERGDETKERNVVDAIVAKPGANGRYTYVKVKDNSGCRNANTPQPVAGSKTRADAQDEDEAWDDVYVESKDLAYEKDGKLVYETDEYVFIAKDVEQPRTDYWRLLA